ncbi:hypothetical protein FB446DRAFT_800973 [Lentinula raphanica]|nr:hypothetical protein FB446DRAFT_800973 [Lentinula raphanica]
MLNRRPTNSNSTTLSPLLALPQNPALRRQYLSAIIHACIPNELLFISTTIAPLSLNRDFLRALPPELALHVLRFVDTPKTLARAAQVSQWWKKLVNDESSWKRMCAQYEFIPPPRDRFGGSHSRRKGQNMSRQSLEIRRLRIICRVFLVSTFQVSHSLSTFGMEKSTKQPHPRYSIILIFRLSSAVSTGLFGASTVDTPPFIIIQPSHLTITDHVRVTNKPNLRRLGVVNVNEKGEVIVGSYTAPELREAHNTFPTTTSDVFSLGAIISTLIAVFHERHPDRKFPLLAPVSNDCRAVDPSARPNVTQLIERLEEKLQIKDEVTDFLAVMPSSENITELTGLQNIDR